jgi:hypothetical protein
MRKRGHRLAYAVTVGEGQRRRLGYDVYRAFNTTCAFLRLALECRDAGQGDTRSIGADGIWGLFCKPPECAREQCAGPDHYRAASALAQPVAFIGPTAQPSTPALMIPSSSSGPPTRHGGVGGAAPSGRTEHSGFTIQSI